MTRRIAAVRLRLARHLTLALVCTGFACAGVGSYLIYSIACAREATAAELVRQYVRGTAASVAHGTLETVRTGADAAPSFDASASSVIASAGISGALHAEALRDGLRIALVDPSGRVVRGATGDGPAAHAALAAPLDGWTVAASLDPKLAREVGHVGSTRDWTLLGVGVLTLAAGLVAVAALQTRRERALTRVRADFVASVSHELRTPLAQIRVYSELLSLGWVRDEGAQRGAARVIEQESRRLGHLVDNVLHFARLERGMTPLAPQRVALGALLAEVVDGFAPLARAEGANMELAAHDDVDVWGERDALRQVLLNLLDNAVKYGPAGQTVTVGARRDGELVRVWVEDEGPGIAPEDAPRIWEPFTRLPTTSRTSAGSGIGLAVVRQLAAAMEGSATVERSERGGARFVLSLRAAPGAAAVTDEHLHGELVDVAARADAFATAQMGART